VDAAALGCARAREGFVKRTLDRAIAEISAPMTGLRAVVLSAAPDGLLAWAWSNDGDASIALGFAALARAATMCLESLGASQRGRSLLLTAEDTWVGAWPLHELEAGHGRERLVVTVVFAGTLQAGLVMVYGARIRTHLRMALEQALAPEPDRIRAALLEHVLTHDDVGLALERVAAACDVPVRALARPEQLGADERTRVLQVVTSGSLTH
jgi:hypothetical protein